MIDLITRNAYEILSMMMQEKDDLFTEKQKSILFEFAIFVSVSLNDTEEIIGMAKGYAEFVRERRKKHG